MYIVNKDKKNNANAKPPTDFFKNDKFWQNLSQNITIERITQYTINVTCCFNLLYETFCSQHAL